MGKKCSVYCYTDATISVFRLCCQVVTTIWVDYWPNWFLLRLVYFLIFLLLLFFFTMQIILLVVLAKMLCGKYQPSPPPLSASFLTQIQPSHIDTGRQNTICTRRH